MSIPEAEDRNTFDTLALYCYLRSKRVPEKEIVQKLHFPDADALHRQLRDWQLPDWMVGQDSAASSTEKRNRTKNRPRPQTLGPTRELPPPGNATPLFRERLEALLESAERLKHMEEDLRGEYFVRNNVGTVSVHISRKRTPGDTGSLVVNVPFSVPGGVAKSPSEALAILISVYALAGGRMDLLVDALQRDPPPAESEVWDEIEGWVDGARAEGDKRDGLKVLARGLATWVRGSEVRTGKPSELSPADHDFACTITHHRKHGLTDEEIARRESHRKKGEGSSYSVKDVTRLGDLGL